MSNGCSEESYLKLDSLQQQSFIKNKISDSKNLQEVGLV